MFEYLDRMKQWLAARGFPNLMSDDEYEKNLLEWISEFQIPFSDEEKETLHGLIHATSEKNEYILYHLIAWKVAEACLTVGGVLCAFVDPETLVSEEQLRNGLESGCEDI